MAKDPLDDQIDQLYQLGLDEFTAARNALAKKTGPRAAEIKQLEKPNLAAWAVNQLFWRERAMFDALIKTATGRREAYRQILAGKAADVREAEADHTASLRQASESARRILEEGGNKVTDAVMTALGETLDALPSADPPGRLTRALRRIGFEGLEGLPIAAAPKREKAAAPKPVEKASVPKAPSAAKGPSTKDREADQAKARELAMTKERLRFAEAAEREAEESLGRAQRTVERAERIQERVEQELADAAKALEKARREESAAAALLKNATAERAQLTRGLS